jgi:hypothetical protein
MVLKPEPSNRKQGFKLSLFYFSFSVLGIALAFWFGLGWFILFQTIRSLFFTVTRLRIFAVRALIGEEFADLEELKLPNKRFVFFVSKKSAISTVFMIIITVLFFWKINIPLVTIFHLF